MIRFSKRKSTVVAVILAVALIAIYAAFDPADTFWMPKCITYQLTGFKCPGCGSQRMIHALLTGNFVEAFRHNAFLVIMIPVILFMVWIEVDRKRHMAIYTRIYGKWGCVIFCVLIVIWTVLRNIYSL